MIYDGLLKFEWRMFSEVPLIRLEFDKWSWRNDELDELLGGDGLLGGALECS